MSNFPLKSAASVFWVLLILLAPLHVQAEEGDEERSRHWGFAYPGGYDINTVRSLKATVVSFNLPEHGPVIFDIEDDRRTYRVLAGPHWFWEDKPVWNPGDGIHVKGSVVLGRDGRLYIMAAEIGSPDDRGGERIVRLRDRQGVPVWMGRHRMMRGRGRGMMR